ncbi:GNAT family N-acetyltransferase [Aquimarina sp. D1M17]|uniref:GNAT family N-acetyltransferase n=1 Tax=Aquimarina acroporae TaxID=2937283 RepID=UPI0020BF7E65|nr:GNAT family N-acetyltransferase [Aquimarina acroporae]MCK8520558.1 GNAT family N-acetyltransferase [Aquimarina acroporae]
MRKENIDYFFEVFEKNNIPKLFSKIDSFEEEGAVIDNPDYDSNLTSNPNTVYSVFFIPDYLRPILDANKLNVKKVDQFFRGYAILLKGFNSADEYIKSRFRSNAKGIRRRIKRLESCFDISYKTFYGNLEKEVYDDLMNRLEKMLVKRFEQRNDVSQTLTQWDRYKKMYFSLINEKRASLFVVYHENTPIVISLNHHFQGRLFSAISSYDIDFGKFSLGSVEIYKKLDWCIANQHQSYEMGMGDLSYKREWCNHIYNFEHQIIYPKSSMVGWLKGNLEYLKVSAKELVFKLAYVKYKEYKAKRKKINIDQVSQYKALSIEETKAEYNNLSEVDYNSEDFKFLRKYVFDFLYSSIENVANVKVCELAQEANSYVIIGTSKTQKIVQEA